MGHTDLRSCQIYRPDPRSEKMSQYLLMDPVLQRSLRKRNSCGLIMVSASSSRTCQDSTGGSADCGVELQILEGMAKAGLGS